VSHFVIISTSGEIGQSRTDNQGHSTAISLHAVKLCRLSYYPVFMGISPIWHIWLLVICVGICLPPFTTIQRKVDGCDPLTTHDLIYATITLELSGTVYYIILSFYSTEIKLSTTSIALACPVFNNSSPSHQLLSKEDSAFFLLV